MGKAEIGRVISIRKDVLSRINAMCNCEDDSGDWTGTSDDP